MKKQLFNIFGSILLGLMVFGCEKDRVSGEISSFTQSVVPTKITNNALPAIYASNVISYSTDYPDWMKYISDDQPLGNLTIPGSHNAGAANDVSGVAYGIYRCQEQGIAAQLNAGIRALDLRLRINSRVGNLDVYHSDVYMGNFDKDVLEPVEEFLKAHPSETVLMFLKQEGGNDKAYNERINAFIGSFHQDYLFNNDNYHGAFTKLKDCRGKMILMNRTNSDYDNWNPRYRGEKISNWPENNAAYADGLAGGNRKYLIADNYSVPNLIQWAIDEKKANVFSNLTAALNVAANENTQFITYTSGSSGAAYPIHVAKRLNVPTADFVNKQVNNGANKHLGIIMSDFTTIMEGKQLISACVMQNIYSLALDKTYR